MAVFYTDYLWFDSLGFTGVWRSLLLTKIGLSVVFMAIMFGLTWANLVIADSIAPAFRPPGPEEDFVQRYHEVVVSRMTLVRIGTALLFALFLGAGAGARWEDWVLFRNARDFGVTDPQFGVDVGFYVFQLPFIRFMINWTFTAFIVVLIITATAHYLNGVVRLAMSAVIIGSAAVGLTVAVAIVDVLP